MPIPSDIKTLNIGTIRFVDALDLTKKDLGDLP